MVDNFFNNPSFITLIFPNTIFHSFWNTGLGFVKSHIALYDGVVFVLMVFVGYEIEYSIYSTAPNKLDAKESSNLVPLVRCKN